MRVLYVEFVTGFGGSLTALLDTVNALGGEIDPILVIPYDPSPHRPIPSNLEVRVVTPPALSLRDSRNGRGLTRYVRNTTTWVRSTMNWVRLLDEVVREVRPALIHANNGSGMNLAAGIVGKRHGIPVVSHQRCTEYPGWPNWLVIKRRLYSHHIAVSRAMVPSLTRLGLAESLCTVIYDPIPAPPPPSNRLKGGSGPRLTVAMYSMLVPWKGQDVFLHAISKVAERVSITFRVMLGGGEPFGGSDYVGHLRRLVSELGLETRVEFTGFVQDIYSRLQKTDVLVLASIAPEPGGHIVQEAMMCGVPVIVTDNGGPSEYARDSEGGLVVPRGDVEAMADAIERLLLDSDSRAQLARRGQEYARRAFDPITIGSQFSTVYRACLNQRPGQYRRTEVSPSKGQLT
jgi:glycosyltransferase involved in cell wall biosynthesis